MMARIRLDESNPEEILAFARLVSTDAGFLRAALGSIPELRETGWVIPQMLKPRGLGVMVIFTYEGNVGFIRPQRVSQRCCSGH